MTLNPTARAGLHPSLVLSAYIEPLLRGRRVAIFGDATIGLAEELSKRGARLTHAYDPDPARAAEAMARSTPDQHYAVSYAVLAGDLGVRDGAFDVVIVPDLSIFPDAAEVLRRARRILAPGGASVIVTPNLRGGARRLIPEAAAPARGAAPPGYYELYDLVSLQFSKVKMIGQAPFVGYTVADFAPRGEPEVSVDTSFLPSSEEPEHFIAIASDRALTIDAYTVVALPWSEIGGSLAGSAKAAGPSEEEKLALTEARTSLAVTSAELEKLRDRQTSDARDGEARTAKAAALSTRVVELELSLEARDARLREVEARSGDNHVRAERLSHQIRELEEELRHQRERATRLSKQLDDEKKSRTKAELELGMIRGVPAVNPKDRERLDTLSVELEAARNRIAELETEQVATQRRVQIPANMSEAGAVADLKLRHRVNELETAAAAALRDAAAANAARDAVLERLRRAEAKAERIAELEAQLAAMTQAKDAHAEKSRTLEARRAESERAIAELERHLATERTRVAESERRSSDARAKLVELEGKRAADRARVTELERRMAESDALYAERDRLRAESAQRELELGEARSAAEATVAELATLEAALRDRGHLVAALKRDLRESERIGRELLAELDLSRMFSGAPLDAEPPAPASDSPEALRARLDALAESAARTEADLQAARWHVAKLERDLAQASAAPHQPTVVQAELETALARARDEVAALRRATAT